MDFLGLNIVGNIWDKDGMQECYFNLSVNNSWSPYYSPSFSFWCILICLDKNDEWCLDLELSRIVWTCFLWVKKLSSRTWSGYDHLVFTRNPAQVFSLRDSLYICNTSPPATETRLCTDKQRKCMPGLSVCARGRAPHHLDEQIRKKEDERKKTNQRQRWKEGISVRCEFLSAALINKRKEERGYKK